MGGCPYAYRPYNSFLTDVPTSLIYDPNFLTENDMLAMIQYESDQLSNSFSDDVSSLEDLNDSLEFEN